jgi:patatin-like phospholipase/acyl hydrolase
MRVLAIDGGGIRGVIPAVLLAELERRAERPVCELFDLIAGTSTGGILAAALSVPGEDGKPRLTAAQVAESYELLGPRVFHRSLRRRITSADGLADERYGSEGLKAALAEQLGEALLSQTLTDVVLTAYDLGDRRAVFFRTWRARADPAIDVRLADAVLATASAPTYFEPARVRRVAGGETHTLVDGGVFATNPAMCALAEVARMGRLDEVLVVSLGTGSKTDAIPYEKARDWGRIEWAQPILDVVFDGVADTVDFQAEQLLPDRSYHRFQIELPRNIALDDARPATIAELRALGEQLVNRKSAEIDEVVAALAAG